MKHNFGAIEKKWQAAWQNKRIFSAKEKKRKKKFYCLEMYPYPSAAGLHMGHAFNYIIGDIYARFKRMQGFNVLYPMGYDSFGLPAENAAIKARANPKSFTEAAIKNYIRQQKELGLSYDWNRILWSHDKNYYKWNQFFFLKLYEKGLVYRKKAAVNWCSKCQTVLANEQVQNGKCWRHEDTDVEIKQLEQWFIKTTKYADELLNDINKLKWPERIKIMQENWIGKSHGTEIDFFVKNPDKKSNCIIIHGSSKANYIKERGPQSSRHWMPWLKKNLEINGIKTYIPNMPEDWKPEYSKWKKEFEKNNINENTILIGHSAGCSFIIRWLSENPRKIKKLILVAPSYIAPEANKYLKKFYSFKINPKLKELIEETKIFLSNDDERIIESGKIFSRELNGEIIVLENMGHFVEKDMNKKEFPELLNKIILEEKWPIFTTRADTIFGVTFMVISSQHPRLFELVTSSQKKNVEAFLRKLKSISEKNIEELEKEGAFTGSYAVNPLTNEKIPVYVGNFVVADYGCGMVMAVPGHDQRDYEFAKKYRLPIEEVIKNKERNSSIKERAYTEDGILVNSGRFNGMTSERAREEITRELEKEKSGKKKIEYKLRDWLISRQRYWGTPIPMIYCEKCGIVPVPEKDLPVVLPEKVKFGQGNPLTTSKNFVNVKCPRCKGKARRETDTMDTFFDSSWYFLRFCDNKNKKKPFEPEKVKYWMPVDQYIGGAEHACMHLIYARFFTKALRDLGFLNFNEPFLKLFNQGMLHKDGVVMSKSKGNIILPEQVSEKYGIDTARLFLMSIASPDKDIEWSDEGINGSLKFIIKVINYIENFKAGSKIGKDNEKIESKLNLAVKNVTEYVEDMKYNLAIIEIRKFFDYLTDSEKASRKTIEAFLKMLAPFCPHVAEELWHKIGNKNFISLESWPKCDERKINEKFEKQDEMIENLINDIKNILRILESRGELKNKRKIKIFAIPNEVRLYREAEKDISKRVNMDAEIYDIKEAGKTGKTIKAKPGKPGIFIQ